VRWSRSSSGRPRQWNGAGTSFCARPRGLEVGGSMITAEELIALLHLQPHPKEGGYFRETYRSADRIAAAHLPARYRGDRCASTAIYYLLTPGTFSALHRLASDEFFH